MKEPSIFLRYILYSRCFALIKYFTFWLSSRRFCLRISDLSFRNFLKASYFFLMKWRTSPSIQGGHFLSLMVLVGISTAPRNIFSNFSRQSSILSVDIAKSGNMRRMELRSSSKLPLFKSNTIRGTGSHRLNFNLIENSTAW